ncbi:cytochrome d ubiquinol oxidase subunit II [Rheinheimera texasensis]|jgi:cytochrome d ubiquinol oxidase subunit II|uniref:cytochrome d ubiquinol oxidase subunit II n=1 Tax=Rheinheimera texasensis TaxID=306205 RepID=UPI0004E1FB2E|nr:cytochrome d ubiquinol oxidase subunit II [Rheinheimera texasensis]
MDLPLFYFLLLGFAILMYVLLDGFDLGIGILYPWFRDEADKDQLMRSISHVWDGNETWLVFGGVILFGAFPAAYAGLTSALYAPIMLMLIGLIFRGVAFEYRFKSTTSKRWWNRAFAIGSTVAAFCQGLMLGVLIGGTPLVSASPLDLLTPFTLFTGFALLAGYALLGCTYLVMKCRDGRQQRAARYGRRLVWVLMGAMLVVSIATAMGSDEIWQRWFGGWHFLWLWPLPLLSVLAARLLYRDLGRVQRQLKAGAIPHSRHEDRPFWLAVSLFALGFAGLLVSLFPAIVPGKLSYVEAAAPQASLQFMLPGVLIFVPLILAYTCWGYRIFAGKVEDFSEGY